MSDPREQLLEGKFGGYDVADMYLRIYISDNADWRRALQRLWKKLGHNEEKMRQQVSAAILFPAYNPTFVPREESPETLLFGIPSFDGFLENDWFKRLQKVVENDLRISGYRREALVLGVVDPIDYQPFTRQAFNWMYTKAEETGGVTDESKERLTKMFTTTVQAYGGAVICNLFTRHAERLKNVLNWRSGYFLERQIYKVYDQAQVLKIKRDELKSTNAQLVKKITIK